MSKRWWESKLVWLGIFQVTAPIIAKLPTWVSVLVGVLTVIFRFQSTSPIKKRKVKNAVPKKV